MSGPEVSESTEVSDSISVQILALRTLEPWNPRPPGNEAAILATGKLSVKLDGFE
jgi:hypothetical protein